MYQNYTTSGHVYQFISHSQNQNQRQRNKQALKQPISLNSSYMAPSYMAPSNNSNSQKKVHRLGIYEPIKIQSKVYTPSSYSSYAKYKEQKKLQGTQNIKTQSKINTAVKPQHKYSQLYKSQQIKPQASKIQLTNINYPPKIILTLLNKQPVKIQHVAYKQPIKTQRVQNIETINKKQININEILDNKQISQNSKPNQIPKTPIKIQATFSSPTNSFDKVKRKVKRSDLQQNLQQQKVQQTLVLSQFKVKYDELKMNYDRLRIQFDDMDRQKKKMEIKFLNNNPQYYQKQIKRLRGEVERLQQQNEDHKYKYLKAENQKKQFQASYKVKQQQLKTILKQLEKQKISNVELKHQNDQKQKIFNRIKVQFQKSNDGVLKNYDEVVAKVNKLEGALKTKNAQYDQLKNNFERTQRRLTQTKEQFKKYKQINQQKIKNLNKNIQANNVQSQKARAESTNTIKQLSEEIYKYKTQRVSAELLKERKSQQVSVIKSNRQLELDVVRLQERIRFLQYELIKKDQIVIELQKTIQKIKLRDQVKQLEEKIANLIEKSNEENRQHEKTKGQLIRQIDKLKIQLMQSSEKVIFSGQAKHANFQQIIRVQLQQKAKLKKELSIKIDQIYNLKSDIDQLKIQNQNTLSQMQVFKKIKKAEEKNAKIDAEVASQYIKNDIDSYKRKIEQLETKLNLKVKQVKDKDSFIMNNLLGRSKAEQVPLILADFQRIFQANYTEKLCEANNRIEDLLRHKQ